VIAYFNVPKEGGNTWTLSRHELHRLDAGSVTRLLTSHETNVLTRILAANWIVESQPQVASQALAETASSLEEGQLLLTCLQLLARLGGKGLEEHALRLVQGQGTPNGIRSAAARYLGTLRYRPALESLAEAAESEDNIVAIGAIYGLGRIEDPRAVDILLELVRDDKQSSKHSSIADALLETRSTRALTSLKVIAADGNNDALKVLANSGLPEIFEYFIGLLDSEDDEERRRLVVKGLQKSGGDRAVDVLLNLLEDQSLPDQENVYRTTPVVDALVAADSPSATPRLIELVNSGNLCALQVLAKSENPSVCEPLTKVAANASGPRLRITLIGLADHWPDQSIPLFAKALHNSDHEIVELAIRGLREGRSPKAVPFLTPLLCHQDEELRRDAARAIENLPPGQAAASLVDIFIGTEDLTVARSLASCLVEGDWSDETVVPELVKKLETCQPDIGYHVIRLLKVHAVDEMGPRSYYDFDDDREQWLDKWISWGKQNYSTQGQLVAGAATGHVNDPRDSTRTWRDDSGRHTVQARLLDLNNGEVHLKKNDGIVVTVPIGRLSQTDQDWVRSQKKGHVP
jgi:HEAT repeat protein